MPKRELVKRYLIFLVGLVVSSFGIALITKASLGTSPISSIPYTLSLIIPELTLGNWTILFSILLIIIQAILLRSKAKKVELILQLVVSFVFGYIIDGCMLLLGWFEPDMYLVKFVALLIGCAILAFGVYVQVVADVVMLPGDSFVRAVAQVTHREFGIIRVISDICMSLIAAALCMIFLGALIGVREGTIIAALLIGTLVRLYTRAFRRAANAILPHNGTCKKEEDKGTYKKEEETATLDRDGNNGH